MQINNQYLQDLYTQVEKRNAGEKEYLAWMERRDKGVPVDESIQQEFMALRDECGLDYVFPFEKTEQ